MYITIAFRWVDVVILIVVQKDETDFPINSYYYTRDVQ